MKKKVLSIFLALMLCLSLLPTAALAEEAGTAGAGDTLAAEQGEGNTVTEQDENSTVTEQDEDSTGTGQDGDNSVTGQGEGNVLSEQSVSAAAFSSAAGTHSHAVGGENVTFTAWTKTDSLPNETGNYYLTDSVTLTETWTPADGVMLDLNGKNIIGETDHAVITVHGTFTLTDCKGTGTITHGNGQNNTGVSVAGGTFHMEGGSITGNSATNGGGVYVFYGTFNMSGGSISGNTATGNGDTTGTGGGVFVGEGSTFSMSGGSITDNTAVNGGGVLVHSGEFNMRGGSITGNTATASSHAGTGNGGGVFVGDGTFNMSGGSITGNTAANGGGVFVGGGEFKVSGGVKISGNNKSDGSNSNVYLSSGKTITVTGALSGAEIGVTTATKPSGSTPVEIAKGDGDHTVPPDDAKVFFADDLVNYSTKLDLDKGVVQLSTGETQMVHPVCGMKCTHTTEHPNVTWKPWSKTDTLPDEADNYYLADSVTLTGTWAPADGVMIDLNGKSITCTTDQTVISVSSGTTFTLTDCYGGGKITHGTQKGLGVYVGGGTFDMYGGSIIGNTSANGGGVYVSGSGTFNLYGGSISGNASKIGGGVFVNGGTFNLYGGSISDNNVSGSGYGQGGGAYVNRGTFNLYGGSISGNRATGNGGGVFVTNVGEFNMSGGSITDTNYSEKFGGGVGMEGGKFNMTGGSISDNKALHNGGVFVNGGAFNMSDGSISGNEATSNGGNSCGGGVRVDKGTFNMTGGSITGNKATGSNDGHGGGVYAGDGGTFNMEGGSITGNNARCGGGVYVVGTFNMEGGSITDNTASSGGGVYIHEYEKGTFTVSGAVQITGNKGYFNSITNNVRLSEGKTITVTGALGGAEIGVTTEKTPKSNAPITIANGYNYTLIETDRDCFTPDKGSEYQVNLSNNTLVLAVPLHEHSWKYTASGDTITAKCSGCSISGGSVTIQAPTRLTYDGTAKAATLRNGLDRTISVPGIIYAKGGTTLSTAPVDAGEYTASITMGSATAKVTFKIAKADAPAPSGLTGYVGKALSTVVLPDGWTWVDGEAVMNTAGDAVEFMANYGGDNNHNPANNVAVSVKVVETSGGGSTGGNTGGNTGGGNTGGGSTGGNTGGSTGGNTGGSTGGNTGGNTGGGSGHRVSTSAPAAPAKLPTLLLGSRSSDVKTLQEMLNAKGYNAGSVDGIFGRNTRAAVIAFQNANGLAADGIVGKLTWARLYDTTAALPSASTAASTQPTVYRGSRGDAVRRLQELLNKKGFDCGAVDGIFGSKTYAAVMAFQKANGLSADGIAGPLTWGKLG